MRTRSFLIEMSLITLFGAYGSACGGGGGGGESSGKLLDPEKCDKTPSADKLPCDVYADDGGPCVAAHSTVRKLLSSYSGPLYQVRKTTSDGATSTHDILPTSEGIADAADQDSFCGTDSCTISKIYDQSTQKNDLTKAPPGMAKTTPGNEANAIRLPLMVAGGKKVYGLNVVSGVGYRNNEAKGTAKGDDAETEYMVVGGKVYNASCCFDYGNMETNSHDNGEGTMEAVYFGSCTVWNKGGGDGPWVMGDLENGLWAGNSSPFAANGSVDFNFVTGLVKGDKAGSNHWNIKVGNAQSGPLTNPFNGPRPSSRYNPMRKEGAIGLGTGGDNSNSNKGQFFEGVMTAHYSSACADEAVQANIAAFYANAQIMTP